MAPRRDRRGRRRARAPRARQERPRRRAPCEPDDRTPGHRATPDTATPDTATPDTAPPDPPCPHTAPLETSSRTHSLWHSRTHSGIPERTQANSRTHTLWRSRTHPGIPEHTPWRSRTDPGIPERTPWHSRTHPGIPEVEDEFWKVPACSGGAFRLCSDTIRSDCVFACGEWSHNKIQKAFRNAYHGVPERSQLRSGTTPPRSRTHFGVFQNAHTRSRTDFCGIPSARWSRRKRHATVFQNEGGCSGNTICSRTRRVLEPGFQNDPGAFWNVRVPRTARRVPEGGGGSPDGAS